MYTPNSTYIPFGAYNSRQQLRDLIEELMEERDELKQIIAGLEKELSMATAENETLRIELQWAEWHEEPSSEEVKTA